MPTLPLAANRSLRAAVAALLAGASLAWAGAAEAVLIDAFTTDQTVVQTGPGIQFDGVSTGGSSIGGARAVTLEVFSGGTASVEVNTTPSVNDFSTSASAAALVLLTYDGDTNGTLNASGLGGIDLTADGSQLFSIVLRSDLEAPIRLVVYSGSNNRSRFEFSSPGAGLAPEPYSVVSIPFSSLVIDGGTGADFSNVGAITFGVDGSQATGLDLQIDSIETIVPEPSVLVLASLGLAGLAAASRSRRPRV